VGLLRDPTGKSLVRNGLAVVAGLLVIYLAGIPWLAFVAFKGTAGFEPAHLTQAFFWATGPAAVPLLFVVGDVIKAVGILVIASVLTRLPGVAALLKK
jgi:biotin transporter BioY